MSEPFMGEIRMFASTFAPKGWTDCHGQAIPVDQNQALFSLLGIQFGGDGRMNFNLPDYRGRTPVGMGTYSDSLGSIEYNTGQKGGLEDVTLSTENLPPHRHDFQGQNDTGNLPFPVQKGIGKLCAIANQGNFYGSAAQLEALAEDGLSSLGGSQSHNNLQPSLVMRFALALQGAYPSRN
jgi:microcystin-dependent protein